MTQLAGLHSYDDRRKTNYRFGTRRLMCILPSEGVPSGKEMKMKPTATLELEVAHGYNGNGVQSRDNLFLDNGNLIYYIAGCGIVNNVADNTQMFFTRHNDDISCMAVDPTEGSELVASGQVDPKDYTKKDLPKIWIWNRRTAEKVKLISDVHTHSVLKVGWSHNNPWLYSIGGDENHEFKIWNTEEFTLGGRKINGMEAFLFQCGLHKEEIFGMKVNPYPSTVPNCLDELVVYGKRKISFIQIMKPRAGKDEYSMKKKDVSFSTLPEIKKNKKLLEKAYLCVSWLPDSRFIVGAPSGFCYLCERNTPLLRFQAHRDMVGAITPGVDFTQVITTGWDGLINVWTYDPVNVKMMLVDTRDNIRIADSDFEFKPRSIAYSAEDETLFVGSKTNQIVKYEMSTNDVSLVVDGHDGQVWGLATHPTETIYVTGGYDNVLKVWDAESRVLVDTYEFELEDDADAERVTSACWSNDGRYVAVGLESSKVAVFIYENEELKLGIIHTIPKKNKQSAQEAVQMLQFSADNGFLAVAHMDSQGYIYTVEGDGTNVVLNPWQPMVMNAAPTNLQWSLDGHWLKYLTRDYEVCHYELDYNSQRCHFYPGIPDPDDVEWAGDPLIAGWDVKGLYQREWDGTDLNDASLSADGQYIASGDDFGKVRLHNYPALDAEAHRVYGGHSSFVVGVEFMRTGTEDRLITCGGNDMAIFQWKLTTN